MKTRRPYFSPIAAGSLVAAGAPQQHAASLPRIVLLALLLLVSLTSQAQWRFKAVNMQGMGYVTGLVIHPDTRNAPNQVCVRTDVGGLFLWNNATNSWSQLLNDVRAGVTGDPTFSVESVAFDPSNPDRIYVATGLNVPYQAPEKGDIFASADRGQTWQSTGFAAQTVGMSGNAFFRGSAGERLLVDPNDPGVLLFGSRGQGLWRKQGAAAWARVGGGLPTAASDPGVTFVVFDKNSGATGRASSIIYAGVYGSGVWRSADAGASWTRIGSDTNPLRASLAPDGQLLYVTFGGREDAYVGPGAVRRYNGTSWQDITPPKGTQASYSGISVQPANPNQLVVTTNQGDFYKSSNRGDAWTAIPATFTAYPSWYWGGDFYRWGTAALVFDPNDATGNRVWSTNGFGVIRTDNAFAAQPTWQAPMQNLEEYCPNAISVPPVAGGADLFTAQWDGIGHRMASRDQLPSQRLPAPNTPFVAKATSLDYCPAQPQVMAWVGLQQVNAGSLSGYSTDNGLTWSPFGSQSPGRGGVIAFSATDPRRLVWHPDNGSGSGFSYSTDAGQSWLASAGLPATSWYRGWYGRTLAADRVNGSAFYMLHDAGDSSSPQFFRSTDGGANWANTGASFADAATYSLNATVKTHPYQAGQLWVAFSPNDNVPAADLPTKFKLWYSADGGTSFRAVAGVQAAYNVALGAGTTPTMPALYIYGIANGATREGIYRSLDLGLSWSLVLDQQLGDVRVLEGDLRTPGLLYYTPGGCRGFAYAQLAAPLPVELVDFSAQPDAQGRAVLLTWRTASERNSARWHVERSADGQVFARIGTREAAGTSARPTAYAFRDDKPATSLNNQLTYYRLRQEDADGALSYSPVRSLRLASGAPPALVLFPNPARAEVAVWGAAAEASVQVFDALGRSVIAAAADVGGTARLALPAGLPPGVYIVRSGTQARRLTVE